MNIFVNCYEAGWDELYFADDLPKFPYQIQDNFLAVWEVISSIAQADEE